MLGGAGNAREPSKREKIIIQREKSNIESVAETTFTQFEPVLIKIQVVAGQNFLVKILVDNDEYIHVKLFIPLGYPETPATVNHVLRGKTLDDKL
jgi:hypothetical protein